MAGSPIEVVKACFDAVNRKDEEAVLVRCHDDVVWDWSRSRGPHRGVYRGKAELLQFWRAFGEAWDGLRWDGQEFIDAGGGCVVAVNRLRATGRGSGLEISGVGAQLWRVREGKAESCTLYQTRDEALAAVSAIG